MRLLVITALLALVPVGVPDAAEAAGVRGAPEPGWTAWQEEVTREPPSRWLAAVERQARDHHQAVAHLFAAAAQYEAEQVDRAAALAAVGYTGEVDDARVVLPLASYRLTARYGSTGTRWLSAHSGLDFAAPLGTTLVAAGTGTVRSVGVVGAYGLRTVLTLSDGTELWYCHQLASLVVPGESVEIGTPVGLVGSTGNSTGPHLHLEVRPEGGLPVDPLAWFGAFDVLP